MKRLIVMILPLLLWTCSGEEIVNELDIEGYTLVWNDEFDSDISSANWTYETGNGTDFGLPPGWGNSELQSYTSSSNNANIQGDEDGNSVLAITVKKEGTNRYTSAKLTTRDLLSVRFGRVEARIKVPQGKGMWPAFWMLGDNFKRGIDWPGSGEIDIMEVIGHEPNVVHSSIHYANSNNKHTGITESFDTGVNLSEDYRIYRVEWTDTSIAFSIDDTFISEVPIEDDMKEFLRPFYLILNVAVGGTWPGSPDETTEFPQKMMVDWVRVYEKDGAEYPAIPDLNVNEETVGLISSTLWEDAFNSTLNQFDELVLKSFGAGGEPEFVETAEAVDGGTSVKLSYPGGNWGGAFFVLEPSMDLSAYSSGNLVFSLNYPPELDNLEVKLESLATTHSLFIKDYTPTDIGNGWYEYSIPMADFSDLDITDVFIPFALWNPVNANEEYFVVDILVDNIYFEQ